MIDTRNCQNYYRCRSNQCDHCPCPIGETFNSITGQCDGSLAHCGCGTTTQEPATGQPSTPFVEITVVPIKPSTAIVNAGGQGRQNGDGHDNSVKDAQPVSTEVIIIAGIVSATVIVIVVIVMAVFCWQRRQTQLHK